MTAWEMSWRKRGPAEAIAHSRRTADIRPENARFHYNLALNLGNNGQFGEAVESFKQALRIDPKFDDGHGALGMALLARGDSGKPGTRSDIVSTCSPGVTRGEGRSCNR